MKNSKRREIIKVVLSAMGLLGLGRFIGFGGALERVTNLKDQHVLYHLKIVFPENKGQRDYQNEKHQWIDQDAVDRLINKFRARGELLSVNSRVVGHSEINRYFLFNSSDNFKAWRSELMSSRAIDCQLQAKLAYKAHWTKNPISSPMA